MQGLDMGTTPGRGSARSGGCGGMVQRLVHMFKGEHSAEALQACSPGQQHGYIRHPQKAAIGFVPCHGCCSGVHVHWCI